MKRKLLIAGAVVGVLVLGLVGFGVFRHFFPTEGRRVFQEANRLAQGSMRPGAFGEWTDGRSLYILGDEACGGYFWAYDLDGRTRSAAQAELVYFVDLEEGYACPLSEAALETSREPIPECPPCALEEYERLAGMPAARPQ